MTIEELALRYGTANKLKLLDRRTKEILYNACRPIHYKDLKFEDCHMLFSDTKKSQGPPEAFRQRYGEEKNNATGIVKGFIYLTDWIRPLMIKYTPIGKIKFPIEIQDYKDGITEFSQRFPHMLDKGIPLEKRINAFVSEFAAKRFLKRHAPNLVLEKEVHSIRQYNDHDLRLVIAAGKLQKCDLKSLQSSYETWATGNKIKDDILYVFTGPATEDDLILYGYRLGKDLPKDRRIKQADMLDISYLLGWLGYKQLKIDLNML